ncbi:MAG: LysM peptidoglycan-binding domain-containing protein [Thermodesulfobacteriota bacterium]|nr:LysM peptidoglycan-binding domain-containing protein [Thermodesulfobacteriota bacterium]
MRKLPSFVFYCLLIVLSAVLTACSSLTTTENFGTSRSPQVYTDCEYDQIRENQIIPVESEQDLEEELAGLAKSGDWKADGSSLNIIPGQVVYDFPVTINKQVEFYLDLFQNKQKKYFKRWLARSGKYLPAIHHELRNAGLPQDLVYLAMIESGFNPSAYSHAHAAGLWQFIRGTGRNYGLRIDSWVDERREPEKATKAAIAYLGVLYERFRDWHLAVAAYNAGEGKIERAIKKYNTRDFWKLAQHKYLRLETKRYVPKLIAAILIARNPEHYGFTDIDYHQPVRYDLIKVPPRTDLRAIAVSGSTTVKKIRKLNNELRKNQTPPTSGSYALKIPAGSYDMVAANLTRLHPMVTTGYKTHKVRKGDTIGRISKRYRVSMTTLLKANKLHTSKLKIGQRLRIPYKTTKYVLLKEGQTPKDYYASASNNGRMVLHELSRGETLSKISKRYNVPVELIVQWNDITDVRRIRAGNQLAIYLDQDTTSPQVASTPAPSAATTIFLADVKKRKPVAGNKGEKARKQDTVISYYKVRNGDSLWSIAKKFRVSARDIRQWNGLRNNMIHPGKKLKIIDS